MQTRGSRLRFFLKDLNITQKQFVKRLKISYIYMNKILNHKKVPSVQLLDLICKTFHINSKWLKEGTGEVYKDKDFIEYQKAFDKFQRLSPIFKKITLKFMQLLIDIQEQNNINN